MLSKEDQRRFDQIIRHLRESDPNFVARLSKRAQARRGRFLILLAITLWASLPAAAVIGGPPAAAVCGVLIAANAMFMWRFRRRWS